MTVEAVVGAGAALETVAAAMVAGVTAATEMAAGVAIEAPTVVAAEEVEGVADSVVLVAAEAAASTPRKCSSAWMPIKMA